jgi:transcriptional regulator with XRE-family HTH domain
MAGHDGDAYDAYMIERARVLRAFGEKLRAECERRNLSQEGFAELAGLHRNEISYLERGEREPYLLTLLILEGAFGVTLKGLPMPKERRPARRSERGRGRGGTGEGT